LRRIEREAAAARAYREIESRYRELSLAHLYRVVTRGLDGLRGRLEEARTQAAELAARERDVREEEAGIESRLQRIEDGLGKTEQRLEALEDGAEELRVEALRSDRTLLRLEAGQARGRETRLAVFRLEDELRRVSQTVAALEERAGDLEA
jgi:chromosome segregation protein